MNSKNPHYKKILSERFPSARLDVAECDGREGFMADIFQNSELYVFQYFAEGKFGVSKVRLDDVVFQGHDKVYDSFDVAIQAMEKLVAEDKKKDVEQ